MNSKELGKLLQEARKAQRIRQRELQDLSGVSASVIYKLESGREDVTLGSLLALCEALGVRVTCESPLGTKVNLHG